MANSINLVFEELGSGSPITIDVGGITMPAVAPLDPADTAQAIIGCEVTTGAGVKLVRGRIDRVIAIINAAILSAANIAGRTALFFTGAFEGAAGAVTKQWLNGAFSSDSPADGGALDGYPWPQADAKLSGLWEKAQLNTLATDTTLTLFKNNVATALTVTIVAGSVALVSDVTHTIDVKTGDLLKLVSSNNAGVAANFLVAQAGIKVSPA